MNAGVQTALDIVGYALPVDPAALAALPGDVFEVRHQLRGLDLDDEQIACAEQAVALVQRGTYSTNPRNGVGRPTLKGVNR